MSDVDRELEAIVTSPGDWGKWGNAAMVRYVIEINPRLRDRLRRCHCGCGRKCTHMGMANGVALMAGCHTSVAIWTGESVEARKEIDQ